ncbi:MAG: hypothetical protein BWK75_03450 [Candidatus Altiarchaeales archaeon A3]|nr:MAG: hypothetical protein BWK75_03450 [Candidatus Altiarchaeales archaeon A3]
MDKKILVWIGILGITYVVLISGCLKDNSQTSETLIQETVKDEQTDEGVGSLQKEEDSEIKEETSYPVAGEIPGQLPQGGQESGQPPQEVIDACSGKIEGDGCEFAFLQGKGNGTCRTVNNQLVCVPESGPPPNQWPQGGQGPGGQPPQEVIDACSGKIEGDDCEFTFPQGKENGTCRTVNNQLACVPAGGPHPNREIE